MPIRATFDSLIRCHISNSSRPIVFLSTVNHGRVEQELPDHACNVTIVEDLATRTVAFQFS